MRAQAMAMKAVEEAKHVGVQIQLEDERLDLEHMNMALEMRSTAALEQQNAQTDIANDIRAQTLALNGIKEGISAERILSQSQKLLDSAKENTMV
jgi:hypothetical protein